MNNCGEKKCSLLDFLFSFTSFVKPFNPEPADWVEQTGNCLSWLYIKVSKTSREWITIQCHLTVGFISNSLYKEQTENRKCFSYNKYIHICTHTHTNGNNQVLQKCVKCFTNICIMLSMNQLRVHYSMYFWI